MQNRWCKLTGAGLANQGRLSEGEKAVELRVPARERRCMSHVRRGLKARD